MGTEKFGFVAFAWSLMAYFQIVIDYGFNLSATREVSLHKQDTFWLSKQFFSILLIKGVLCLFCLIILGTIILTIPRFYDESLFYLVTFGGVAGTILFPVWFFQGMEEMGYITIFNLISKTIITVFYFILIKGPADYLWFAWLGVIASWSTGIVSFYIVIKRYNIHLTIPNIAYLKSCMSEGFQIFITQVSVSLFTNSNTFVLGLFTNNTIVGQYAIAEKIVRAVVFLSAPIGTAIFPHVSTLFAESKKRALEFLKKILIAGSSIFTLMSILLFIGADTLVWIVSGHKSGEISLLIKIMSILPLSVFVDNIFGTQILLNINLKNVFMWIIVVGGIFSLGLQILLVPIIKATGTATAFVVSELLMMFFMVIFVRKEGIRLLTGEKTYI